MLTERCAALSRRSLSRRTSCRILGAEIRGRVLGSRASCRKVHCVVAAKGFGTSPSDLSSHAPKLSQEDEDHIAKSLGGVNVIVLGDHTRANELVASRLAPLLKYTPLHTSSIIQQLSNASPEELVSAEGESELGLAEARVIERLSEHVRCVISTCGNGVGAAARGSCWRFIFSAVSVWIDLTSHLAKQPQDEAYGQADVRFKIRPANKSAGNPEILSEINAVVESVLPEVLTALRSKLKEDPALCKKKSLYVRLGCRGDWPNIQPPDWAAM